MRLDVWVPLAIVIGAVFVILALGGAFDKRPKQ